MPYVCMHYCVNCDCWLTEFERNHCGGVCPMCGHRNKNSNKVAETYERSEMMGDPGGKVGEAIFYLVILGGIVTLILFNSFVGP